MSPTLIAYSLLCCRTHMAMGSMAATNSSGDRGDPWRVPLPIPKIQAFPLLSWPLGLCYRSFIQGQNLGPNPIVLSTFIRYGHSIVSKALAISIETTASSSYLYSTSCITCANLLKFMVVFLPGINPHWSLCINCFMTIRNLLGKTLQKMFTSVLIIVMGL